MVTYRSIPMHDEPLSGNSVPPGSTDPAAEIKKPQPEQKPPYPQDELERGVVPPVAADWIRWARARVSDLEPYWDRLQADLWNAKVTLENVQSECDAVVKEKDKVISGLEQAIADRLKTSRQVLELGIEVLFGPNSTKGRIDSVLINTAGVSYRVAWWEGARRLYTMVRPEELDPVDAEPLPLRPGHETYYRERGESPSANG
jgi:hypothetical protein